MKGKCPNQYIIWLTQHSDSTSFFLLLLLVLKKNIFVQKGIFKKYTLSHKAIWIWIFHFLVMRGFSYSSFSIKITSLAFSTISILFLKMNLSQPLLTWSSSQKLESQFLIPFNCCTKKSYLLFVYHDLFSILWLESWIFFIWLIFSLDLYPFVVSEEISMKELDQEKKKWSSWTLLSNLPL